MKQEELAAAIGKTRSLISHFERTGNVNKYTLQEIAEVLQVDLDTLENLPVEGIQLQENEEYSTREGRMAYKTGKISGAKSQDKLKVYQLLINKQQSEIAHLKDTISHQWKLLQDITRKIGKGSK